MAEQMNSEPGTKPNPDPTVATNEAVERAMKAERDYVDGVQAVLEQRLAGIDEATKLRLDQLPQLQAEIDVKVAHLDELVSVKFKSIEDQLVVAETLRVEQKADSKTGLDAALQAQKEAASEQNKSNTLAISKSEQATAETIKTNQELTRSKTDELTKGLDEVKLAISRLDATKQGNVEQRQQQHASTAQIATIVGSVGALIGVVVVLSNVLTGA